MRCLFSFAFLFFLISCSGKMSLEDSMDLELKVKMDTVYLDSKGENIFVFNGLSVSDLSEDKRVFYNFDFKTPSIEVLNLESLEFEERILLEKEGPDGVGEMVYHFNLLGDSLFFAGSVDQKFGVFDMEGKKDKSFSAEGLDRLKGLPQGMFSINQALALQSDPLAIIGEFRDWSIRDGTKKQMIGVWHVDEEHLEEFKIEDWFDFGSYSPLVDMGGYEINLNAYWFQFEPLHFGILVSTNLSADLLSYNAESDKFELVKIDHSLFQKEVKTKLPQRFETRTAFDEASREIKKEINFSKPVWDADNEIFYRFAYKEKAGEGQSSKAEVYLTVMDSDFKVLHEIALPQMIKSPNFHFVKDGQIWMFENVEDEVSFVRISVDGVKRSK